MSPKRFYVYNTATAFATGGVRGQSFEETTEILAQRYLGKMDFRTPVGERIAVERQAYAKEFLRWLRDEL